jgi:GTP-binding protein HflX
MVCLVGYTNAGKSTLLNALAPARAYVDDRLFATLDTKTRMVYMGEGRKILLTDTVGFIRHLPHELVASFRSTLEEAVEADLLLVVADAGHARMDDHLQVVEETLAAIGAEKVPRVLVLNKWDRVVGEGERERRRSLHPWAVAVSALKKEGLDALKKEIDSALSGCHAYRKP